MPHGRFDAIVVPGGNITAEGELAPRNFPRLDLASEQYFKGVARWIIITGGYQLFANSAEFSEAELGKNYLVEERDIPAGDILTVDMSRDTIGNAVDVKRSLLLPRNWHDILIVTSKSHEVRCRNIFDFVLGDNFNVESMPAPERFARIKRAGTMWGVLTMHHIFNGIERGDHEAITKRLGEQVPGYGSNVTLRQLRKASVVSFLQLSLASAAEDNPMVRL